MIVDEDVQHLRRLLDCLRKADVGVGRADVAGRVVVGKDDGRGLFFKGAFQDLPRVDYGLTIPFWMVSNSMI